MPRDKLTEAISRLNEVEMQLGYALDRIGGPSVQNLKDIQTEARWARMRIEEFREMALEALDIDLLPGAVMPRDLRERIIRVKSCLEGQ